MRHLIIGLGISVSIWAAILAGAVAWAVTRDRKTAGIRA